MKAYFKARPASNRNYSKKRAAEIRDIVISAKNIPCADCGRTHPYYVMDFDHVRGNKKFNLSVAASKTRSIKSVKEEIKKCDVVCANCHRYRTFAVKSTL